MPYLSKINLNGTTYDIKASGTDSPVLGVKGENESTYRTGYVNLYKENLGLGNVGNYKSVSTESSQGLSDTEKANARENIGLGTAATRSVPATGNANATQVVLGSDSRLTNSRPASDVYAWAKAETKPTYYAAEVGAIDVNLKGVAGGVAELDSTGHVYSSQLPSYVDDVLEYASLSDFPISGESGKIYVAIDTNKTYRWSGSAYIEIGSSLALGETASTAYRGDRGKAAYDHATDGNRITTATESGLYKIGVTSEGHVASVSSVQKSDITALGIPGSDTTYESKSAASGGVDESLVTTGEKYTWNHKQDTLTFDSAPTPSSNNPVTSGGVYTALSDKVGNADYATASTAGIVKPDGTTITVDSNGVISSIGGGGGGGSLTFIGACASEGSAQEKVATVDSGFSLVKGVRIAIKYANRNTYPATSSNRITLNVNNTGAKNIYYNQDTDVSGTKVEVFGVANRYVYYIYDGSYWVFDGSSIDNNTTYPVATANMITIGTDDAERSIRADYLHNAIQSMIDASVGNAISASY